MALADTITVVPVTHTASLLITALTTLTLLVELLPTTGAIAAVLRLFGVDDRTRFDRIEHGSAASVVTRRLLTAGALVGFTFAAAQQLPDISIPVLFTRVDDLNGMLAATAILLAASLGVFFAPRSARIMSMLSPTIADHRCRGARTLVVVTAVVRAAAVELAYRGLLLTALTPIAGPLLAGTVAVCVAALPVARRGIGTLLGSIIGGAAVTFATIITGSLWPAMIGHLTVVLAIDLGTLVTQDQTELAIGESSAIPAGMPTDQ